MSTWSKLWVVKVTIWLCCGCLIWILEIKGAHYSYTTSDQTKEVDLKQTIQRNNSYQGDSTGNSDQVLVFGKDGFSRMCSFVEMGLDDAPALPAQVNAGLYYNRASAMLNWWCSGAPGPRWSSLLDYIPIVAAWGALTNPLDHLLVRYPEFLARIQQSCHDSSLGVGVYNRLCPYILTKIMFRHHSVLR